MRREGSESSTLAVLPFPLRIDLFETIASRVRANSTAAAAFGVCAAASAYQTLVSYELALILNGIWISAVIVLSVANLSFGAGSYLFQRTRLPRHRAMLPGATGLATLTSLVAFLCLSPTHMPWPLLIPALVLLLLTLTGFGALFGWAMTRAVEGNGSIATACAASSLGYVVGFLASGAAGWTIGVNAALALLGVVLLAVSVRRALFWVLPAALTLFAALGGLDARLESLRPVQVLSNTSNFYAPKSLREPLFKHIYSRWSPYAKVDIYQYFDDPWLFGAYNYRALWNWRSIPILYPHAGFAFIRPTDKVALIGASAGFEARFMPPELPRRNITLVEIDPAVIGFFREHPEKNDFLFDQVTTVVADGRSFLDRFQGSLDALIIGSLDSASRNPWRAYDLGASLYTREGFRRAVDSLAPDGILLCVPRDPRIARIVVQHALAMHLPMRTYYRYVPPTKGPEGDWLYNSEYSLLIGKNARRVAEASKKIEEMNLATDPRTRLVPFPTKDLLESPLEPSLTPITDDSPSLLGHDIDLRDALRSLTFWAVASFIVLIAWLLWTGSAKRGSLLNAYFCLIGCGFMVFQLFVFHEWRSCFGSPASTIWIINALVFGFHGLGNSLAFKVRRVTPSLGIFSVLAAGLYTKVGLWHIPYSDANVVRAVLLSGILLAPSAVLTGFFFPLGLRRSQGSVGTRLFWDASGAAFGFLCFFLLLNTHGLHSAFWLAGTCYLTAALVGGLSL